MNRIIVAPFILGLITMPTYAQVASQPLAQSKCLLTETNAPNVRGLRLGMSVEQLVALFPASTKRKEAKEALDKAKAANNNETVDFSFDPAIEANKERFIGVEAVSVGIYKGRVQDFSVQYVGVSWTNIDEWIRKLSETLNLPGTPEWVVGPNESPNKVLKCSGIEIEGAIQGGGASIRIRNTEYLKGMDGRTTAQEEKKLREFKP